MAPADRGTGAGDGGRRNALPSEAGPTNSITKWCVRLRREIPRDRTGVSPITHGKGVGPVSEPDNLPLVERIAALELIPGHATTAAEVRLWHGRVPEVSEVARRWVVLDTDDWPMSPDAARLLAAALVRAADQVDAR